MRDIYREYAVHVNMKKQKITKPYFFLDKTHNDIIDILNSEDPISLKFNEDLIDRVCHRYPVLKKSEISLIVKNIFSGMRDLLILGKILNFHSLFFDTKLHVFNYRKQSLLFPAIKIKISTPPSMRI